MSSSLISRLDQLAGQKVLCVGDVMLDRFVYGRVDRISPEAPIPVLKVERESVTLGGAGNVARNIAALGGKVSFIGVIGADNAGDELKKHLAAQSGITPHLLTDGDRVTTVKTRCVANGQQLLRADREKAEALSADMEQKVIAEAANAMKGCGTILLSDYAKGVLTPKVISGIMTEATKQKIKVLVDPKGRDFSVYHGAYLLTPNRKELAEVSGAAITTIADSEREARALISKHDLGGVLAKMGGDGVCLVLRDQPMQHFRTTTREVFDVSGAGDTVIATLGLALAAGLSDAESAELANLAGSIVVGKVGTATVSRAELAEGLTNAAPASATKMATTKDDAANMAERWRKQGLKVGFTNGCFDLLHPGHVSLLRQARAACDKLIVGLNTDASVRKLKGDTRPVQNETSRAQVLASLSDVDMVVLFGEDTPYELIRSLRPDVLVKGSDYTVATVVGADLVQGWGGQVLLADLVQGQSTTSMIARSKLPEKKGSAA